MEDRYREKEKDILKKDKIKNQQSMYYNNLLKIEATCCILDK